MADEDVEAEDLDSLDITACKDRILRLRADRERLAESTERMQERLKAVNNELAARKEEADRSRQELLNEQDRNRRQSEQRRQVGAAADGAGQHGALAEQRGHTERQIEKVRHFMEEQLQEYVPKNVQRTNVGTRTFNETELMVQKTAEQQEKERIGIDTVLITYNLPNSDIHYNLSYRVERETTAQKLREDACLYWNVSEVEFILKTMDNSKVHDDLTVQSCFRKDEAAHLILAQKTPKETRVLESEQHAIRPKIGRGSRQKSGEPAEGAGAGAGALPIHDFFEPMKAIPGFWDFMTQRDRKVVAHLSRLKLRFIVLYFVLLCIALWNIINVRPANVEFYARSGMSQPLVASYVQSGVTVNGFLDVRTENDAWLWLTDVLASQLFGENSQVRQANYLPGWLQVRMQTVQAPSDDQCILGDHDDGCFPAQYVGGRLSSQMEEKIKVYWQGCNATEANAWLCGNMSNVTNTTLNYTTLKGTAGRSSAIEPWQWKDTQELADRSGISRFGSWAGFATYPPDGYVVEYDLQYSQLQDTLDAFQQDLLFLKENGWKSHQSRMMHVEWTSYNGNRHFWVSNQYTFEFPSTGAVLPHMEVGLFRPMTYAGVWDQSVAFLDLFRLVVVLYLCTYQIYWEVKQEQAQGKSARNYFTSFLGIVDISVGILFIYIIVVRHIVLGAVRWDVAAFAAEQRLGFQSTSTWVDWYNQQVVLETILCGLIAFRFVSFLRINRHLFVIWTTIEKAFTNSIGTVVVFGAALLSGAIPLDEVRHGDVKRMHGSFGVAAMTTLVDMYGAHDKVAVDGEQHERLYQVLFHFLFNVVLTNAWIAIMIQTYQRVRVSSGYRSSTYKWKEYDFAKWALWSPFLKGYLKYCRPKIWRPSQTEE